MVWQKGYKLQGGRYVIEKVLGEGGFGITYQAQHTLLKQWVVIKTPNEILKNDSEYPNYVKRFIQEGRKLAKLSQQPHPNIVRVTELFEEGKTYCLVMDFVPGESLFNLVQKRGALPEVEAVGYIKQIGEALIFVHHQGLVHRDAHPGNIMVQKNGKAVLIDFGIAGEIMPQDGYFTSHHPANIAFAPYEQMGGNRQVTIDVYTLAASLYYTVTGKRPESSLDRKLYNKPLIPPNKYVVCISNELNWAILKGMNLEAENRPQSMREWLKLLPDFSYQVYQVSQKIEHQTIRTEKTVPVIVGANNSPNVRVSSKNIPLVQLGFIGFLLSLGYITFYYSILGFFSGASLIAIAGSYACAIAIAFTIAIDSDIGFFIASGNGIVTAIVIARAIASGSDSDIASHTAFAIALAIAVAIAITSYTASDISNANANAIASFSCLLITIILGVNYGWSGLAVSIVIWILCIFCIFAYTSANKKLEQQSLSKWKQFFTYAATSSIGLFLGWLLYQLFPIFGHR
ncbi:serine/threonine protein kinase [Dolichospermum sp. FACHB-1091]|uniref:serine/threonine protein kinase n=1 Tax=Dolichospermum sp. FACHB-1091 TaxID=2692798 RepID=UPI0016816A4E|nr:serine/threonine-protein kinase [Dolichospermum sp. FACHB-1091]MBD2442016.1 serine/threonine protein kinase [Dolichospermum sp. FACHB-1091]